MKLTFYKFTKKDFLTYKSWFDHQSIATPLGSIDEVWLEHILTTNESIEYAIKSEGILVAVLGIYYPTPENDFYVISNLAVNPALHHQGIGSTILSHIRHQAEIHSDKSIVSFVEKTNIIAQNFFKKHNWSRKQDPTDKNMWMYRSLL